MSAYGDQEWVKFRNASGEVIPPFAVMEITGSTDGMLNCTKPQSGFDPHMLTINSHRPVPIGKPGELTFDLPAWARYNTSFSPVNGQWWTASAGSWDLVPAGKTNKRFWIVGGATGGRVMVGGPPCCTTSTTTTSSSSTTSTTTTTRTTQTTTTGTTIASTDECSCCPDGAPVEWTFTVSGIANCANPGHCTSCANYNGTFTLQHQGAASCTWTGNNGAQGCIDNCSPASDWKARWQLDCGISSWLLRAFGCQLNTGIVIATYTLAHESFDCFGSNTLSGGGASACGAFGSGLNRCDSWPASITINPG